MQIIVPITTLILGFILGCAFIWWLKRHSFQLKLDNELAPINTEKALLQQKLEQAEHTTQSHLAELEKERAQGQALLDQMTQLQKQLAEESTNRAQENKNATEKIEFLKAAEAKLIDSFKALSSDALKSNNESFLKLAKENLDSFQKVAQGDLSKRQEAIDAMVKPIKESLTKVDEKVQQLEEKRAGAYASLSEQIKNLLHTQSSLQSETSNLVKALRAPQVRGQWGEMQLRRTVEIAGMIDRCDFYEQASVDTEEGRQRPDMVIRLPNERNIIVDSKAPLAAYLEALETTSVEEQKVHLQKHARQIRDHLKQLGTKNYWKQFDPTPEFVVLFLPGETFFSSALEQDPELINYGVENKTILATPTTLIALLKAVAYGWRQEDIAKEAKAISQLGNELYDRMHVMARHFSNIRKGLDRATTAYNDAVSSMESRVLPCARRFKELHAGSDKEIDELNSATTHIKPISADELLVSED